MKNLEILTMEIDLFKLKILEKLKIDKDIEPVYLHIIKEFAKAGISLKEEKYIRYSDLNISETEIRLLEPTINFLFKYQTHEYSISYSDDLLRINYRPTWDNVFNDKYTALNIDMVINNIEKKIEAKRIKDGSQ